MASNGSSPRQELLHGIDPIALPRYNCSGPVASTPNGSTWHFPPLVPGEDYRRAALRSGEWKLVVGGCAEWDCSAAPTGLAPTGLAPPRVAPPGYNTSPAPPLPPLGPGCRNVTAGQSVWLFRIADDPWERCDRALSEPAVVRRLRARLDELNASAVPCRYPDADAQAAPSLHNGTWSSWQ